MESFLSIEIVWVIRLILEWVGVFAVLLAAWVFIGPRIQDRIIAWRARRAAP